MVPKPKRRVLYLKETFAIDRIITVDLMPRNMSPSTAKGFLSHLHCPGISFKPMSLLALIRHRGGRLAIQSLLRLRVVDNIMFCVSSYSGASDMSDLDGNCFWVYWQLLAVIWVSCGLFLIFFREITGFIIGAEIHCFVCIHKHVFIVWVHCVIPRGVKQEDPIKCTFIVKAEF